MLITRAQSPTALHLSNRRDSRIDIQSGRSSEKTRASKDDRNAGDYHRLVATERHSKLVPNAAMEHAVNS